MPSLGDLDREIQRLREWRHSTDKTLDGLHWRIENLERRAPARKSSVVLVANVVIAVCALAALALQLKHG